MTGSGIIVSDVRDWRTDAMLIKRRKLGTVYATSPAQEVQRWLIDNISKIVFAICAGLIWMLVFYFVTGIIRFLGVKIATWQDWETMTAWDLYTTPKFMWANVIGIIVVMVLVLRDRLSKR